MNDKPKARLESWFVHGNRAFGEMHDHPVHGSPGHCATSRILSQSDTEIETLNTIYTLGQPYKDSL